MPAKIWGEYDRGINLVLDEALSWTPDEWRYLRINDLEYWKTGYNALGLLRKGLDPNDPRLTVEGWPAPHRAVVTATAS